MLKKISYIVLLIGLAQFGVAQMNGLPKQANQISDQQLLQLYQQAQASGMSDADISKYLSKKGLSPNDIATVKKRLVQLQTSKTAKGGKALIQDTAEFLRDTAWVKETPLPKIGTTAIYGMEFFNSPNQSFAPNFKIATPKNYILGVDDELIVTLTGYNESIIQDKIGVDGYFPLDHAGLVQLNGVTIEQATQKIKNKLAIAYPEIKTGKTQVFITLGNVRTITVNIIGEARNPGAYSVSSLASFFNVLYLSGGPSDNGSLRKIELIRNNKLIETIDFYSFLQKGTLAKNIRLEDQDIIRIPVYTKRIKIDGEIKKPAIYELLDKETLSDAFAYAGGFGDNAYKEIAKVTEIGKMEKRVRDVSTQDFNYYIPKNADSVYIEKINARFENRVFITGAVNRPGVYELTNDITLKKVLEKAQGLREDAFTNRAYIKRVVGGTEKVLIAFNPADILAAKVEDMPLSKEDSITIISKDSLKDPATVTISGSVRMAGTYVFRKGMKLEDLIAMAGGFTLTAANHHVEINRLKKNTSDTLANSLVDLITLTIDSALYTASNSFELQPLDYIFVPELLNYRQLGNVKIRGEVLYPGDYSLERRDEAVIDLVRRAGGITKFGAFNNTQVYRNGFRVGTNIFSDTADTQVKFLLLPSDSIYVPRSESFVKVEGAVYNQQIVSYETSRFKYYISAAGGTKENAKLKSAYIQYSNGINKKTKRFLFFRKYPKVQPGSKIVVPEKIPGESGLNMSQVTLYTGLITTLVALLSVIKTF